MTGEEILFDAEERMEKAVSVLRDELRGLRTGRATPALVDSLRVEYYGSPTPLKQLAQIGTPDPQQIVIKPFDAGCLKDIEKAIRASDLGLAPNSDGKIIRLESAEIRQAGRSTQGVRLVRMEEGDQVAAASVIQNEAETGPANGDLPLQ